MWTTQQIVGVTTTALTFSAVFALLGWAVWQDFKNR